jgi:OTU domain-containing protein 6
MKEKMEQARKEAANVTDYKKIEDESIQAIVDAMGLRVKEIKPDGHCMYSAIADQLNDGRNYQDIRKLASSYMHSHADDFLPFMTNKQGDMLTTEDFDEYCTNIEKTVEWGGHLELRAASQALSRQIHVIQMSAPTLIIGEKLKDNSPLLLSYHKHAYGLGEHYNSLEKKKN